MSDNYDTFLENETKFWYDKEHNNPDSNVIEFCDTECSGICDCNETTYYVDKCDETDGHCLNCEIDNMWLTICRGESTKQAVDDWISLKTLLISCMKDDDSDEVLKLKKEIQTLHILREIQND